MLRKVIIPVFILLALVSCQNKELINPATKDFLHFSPNLHNYVTRAETNSTSLESGFNVTAFKSGADNLFTDLVVSSEDNGATWKTSEEERWPSKTDVFGFYAYYPQSLSSNVAINKTSQKIENVSIDRNITAQKDIVVAHTDMSKENLVGEAVPLYFSHICSQISVEVANMMPDKFEVKVKGVAIKNINSTGTFTFPSYVLQKNQQLDNSVWTSSTPVVYGDISPAGQSKTLDNTMQSVMTGTDNFFVLPQDLTAWDGTDNTSGTYIAIICQISKIGENSVKTQIFPETQGKFSGACIPIGTGNVAAWKPGYKYVYRLKMFAPAETDYQGHVTSPLGGAGKLDPNSQSNGNDNGNGGGDPTTNSPDGNNSDIDTAPFPKGGKGGDSVIRIPIVIGGITIIPFQPEEPIEIGL